MGQFWIWYENFQRRPKCIFINVFNFSSKNPIRTLESLSRSMNPLFTSVRFSWHKNRHQRCSQECTRPCWKMKGSQNLEVRSNFPLLVSFENNASLQITQTSINQCFYGIFLLLFVILIFGFKNFPSVCILRFGQFC